MYGTIKREKYQTKEMKNSRQIIRFILIGTLNALITAIVVGVMMDIFHVNYLWSNVCGYVAALVNNFFWSKFWIFSSGKGGYLREAILFFVAFICAYCAQVVCLLGMVEGLGWNEYFSQFMGLFVYGGVNFFMNKKVTFHQPQTTTDD